MDDIAGLNWNSTPSNGQRPAPSSSNYSAFTTLKPTPPVSGRASPLNPPSSQPPSKPSTPANDSFANLVPFGGTSNKNLSLLEQQRKQTEAKLQQQKSQGQNLSDQYAGGDGTFWNNLGSGRGTPTIDHAKNQPTTTRNHGIDDDDDLFAVFNKPVPAKNGTRAVQSRAANNDEDDDPFGLSEVGPRRVDTAATATTIDDDEDVLGLLGKPSSARRRHESPPARKTEPTNLHPQDKAVAELVDMGFPAEKAKNALEATESGVDVQAAVGILLNQAHAEARQKTQSRNTSRQGVDEWAEAKPARTKARWDDEDTSRTRNKAPAPPRDKDIEQMATEFGTNFLKTANSFWKQSTKQLQKAVQDLNSDSETGGSSQPKWMREAEPPSRKEARPRQQETEPIPSRRRRSPEPRAQPNMTDEAMMLEGERPTPPPRPSASSQRPDRRLNSDVDSSRDHSPAVPSRLREALPQTQPAFLRQQNQSPVAGSRTSLNRAAAEEQAAQAYVSSARRRKPQPAAAPLSPPVSGSDLLEGGLRNSATTAPRSPAPSIGNRPAPSRPQSQPVKSTLTPPIQVRPPPPSRTVPTVSSIALKASHTAREAGNTHFKRGDYASAHTSYATALSHLPPTHPLTIILLTNRALTALKTGEPKSAITDADKAISLIGPSKGENELLAAGDDAGKPMREYYGKALMHKAEALEQMEKWADAAVVWREAVEGGHGGATSIAGRTRAEKAAAPARPKPAPKPAAMRKPASAPPGIRRPAPTSTKPAEALSRLRAANAALERADDEKFKLGEAVDARINAWRSGKQDNLRALLGSLETVLWEGSGWKKISMADLVLPGKVKVQYMKGIGRVHPDKIPTDATTEQRMIAGAVFSILNEAWDKFKTENNL
ncbi:auxilin-like clathrin-binding protein required for normal clathrin function [Cladophialophora chaetospira]|uniref:Auxilin-like clathrin-binding protein required for normal clathrin function n=1 Tax=Cladophialophora chaetospira TaxID=386627 RepID=A0AA38XQ35_9EURO|nr:auxilin-like clathrin-binding protein required for normal clathrin function [Cladophialophora chaetospira]